MRIVFVTHYAHLYGANRSLLALIDGLAAYDAEVMVLVPREGPITKALSERNTFWYACPFKTWMSRNRWKAPGRLGLNLTVLPFLARRVARWNPDLIHTNSSVTPMGALISEVLSLPHTWHVREFGHRDFGLYYDWGEAAFQALMNRAEATIAVSESVRRHVLEGILAPCHVVYNGVVSSGRMEELRAVERSVEKDTPYTFAIVGKLSPEKGQRQAIHSVKILRQRGFQVRLLIAGNGDPEYMRSLYRISRSLNLAGAVSFLGFVPDSFEVYQEADAVLMCSPHEAMGRVTAEAMAAARPVVGYDSDGTAELIEDGTNGLLYDGTAEGLAASMRRFVINPSWAASLGRSGWKKARAEFTIEVYSRRVHDILTSAVN